MVIKFFRAIINNLIKLVDSAINAEFSTNGQLGREKSMDAAIRANVKRELSGFLYNVALAYHGK